MIRIIVADDHAIVRIGLQMLFDKTHGLAFDDEASSGDELLQKNPEIQIRCGGFGYR